MNDSITITNSQPENKKEQVIWEEKESTIPMKNDELLTTSIECDTTKKIRKKKRNTLSEDITQKKEEGIRDIQDNK